jgi:hypothetical protein
MTVHRVLARQGPMIGLISSYVEPRRAGPSVRGTAAVAATHSGYDSCRIAAPTAWRAERQSPPMP